MSRITGTQLAIEMSNFVNVYGFDKEEFIKSFCRQHRTLQQSMIGLMLATIEHVASDDYRTDARNEQSQKVAKQLLAGYNEEVYKELVAQGTSEESARKYADSKTFRPSNLSFV
jgi:hypothetical protein